MLFKRKLVFTLLLLFGISAFATENSELPLYRRFFIWPDFCLEHLIDDPLSASSWRHDYVYGPRLEIELNDEEDVAAFFDTAYIDRVEKYHSLIPRLNNKKCDYKFCTKCNNPVTRQRHERFGGFFDGRRMDFPIRYYCDCCKVFGIDMRTISQYEEKIVEKWQFSECSPIWSGYFQSYRSPFFDHFVEYLTYCDQHSECRCFWPEESQLMRKILDEIFITFLEIENPDISEAEICNIIWCNWYDDGLYALDKLVTHLSHSFSYSQLKESLYELDPYVSCWFHNPSVLYHRYKKGVDLETLVQEIHKECCDDLMLKIRPMFLELYQSCYEKHPNPEIADAIKLLIAEMNQV